MKTSGGHTLVTASQAMAAFLAATTESDIESVLSAIRRRASNEDDDQHLQYAQLFLQYTIGRPRTAPLMVDKGGPAMDLSSSEACLKSLQAMEELVATGRMSAQDAGERERRIRLALEAHRSMAADKALASLHEAGALTFVAPAAGSSAEKAAAYQKFLDSQEEPPDGSE